jgi:hypothetical protein
LMTFTTHADSGKMPGAAITGPLGLALGANPATSIGLNVAAAGVKNARSSTEYLGHESAEQIVSQANSYFSLQGWNATALSS